MTPALHAPPVDLAAHLPAARANPPAPAQGDGHDHPLCAEADVDYPRPGQAQQPIECRSGTHLVPPCKSLIFDNQQPAGRAGCVPENLRNFQQRP
jgi:hypothetical protein